MLSTLRHAENNLPTFWTTWCSQCGIVSSYAVITKKALDYIYIFHVYLHLPYKSTICIHMWIYHTRILWLLVTGIYIDTFILQYLSYRNISPSLLRSKLQTEFGVYHLAWVWYLKFKQFLKDALRWMAFASGGIQSPKLRMVLWNLNTMRFGRWLDTRFSENMTGCLGN